MGFLLGSQFNLFKVAHQEEAHQEVDLTRPMTGGSAATASAAVESENILLLASRERERERERALFLLGIVL